MRVSIPVLICAAGIMLSCNASAAGGLVVDADLVPSAYSVERIRFQQLLSAHPEIKLRSYRRLKYSGREDELAYALKTGNAPDVLSLSISEYHQLADAGHLLDLSSLLLRQPGGPLRELEYAWTAMREADSSIKKLLLRNGRIYGFVGRPRLHGALVRRSAVPDADTIGDLTAAGTARLAAQVSRGHFAPRTALVMDAELLAYWSIADFAYTWSRLPGGDQSAEREAAVASLDGAAAALGAILHGSVLDCANCGGAGLTTRGAPDQAECPDCGEAWGSLGTAPRPGVSVKTHDEAVGLFAAGAVDMVLCSREDLYPLMDSGVPPSEFRFIPLAGAARVPDVEILCLYARTAGRAGEDSRVDLLSGFLKEYTSQFLAEKDSPLYLWYERALVAHLARRGYAHLFSKRELELCDDVNSLQRAAMPIAGSALDGATGEILSVDDFLELVSIDSMGDMDVLAARIRDGSIAVGGRLLSATRPRRLLAGRAVSLVIVFGLAACLIVLAYKAAACPVSSRAFRACVGPLARFAAALLSVLCLPALFKAAFTVLGACLGVGGLVSWRGPHSSHVGAVLAESLELFAGTCFVTLAAVALSIALALGAAMLLIRMKGWRVVVSFFLALPACLAGFWGVLLLEGVRAWLFDPLHPLGAEQARLAVRVVSVAFAVLPFACMSYMYRLRRIDTALYESVVLDGGTVTDRFFAVTWPALEAPLLLHSLVVSIVVLTDASPGLLGYSQPSLGGALIRAFLFKESAPLLAAVNSVMLVSVLLLVVYGLKRLGSVELRNTFSRGDL